MEPIIAISEKETVERMIVDAKNQLTQSRVLDRLYTRIALQGKKDETRIVQGQNQSKITRLKETIKNLEDIAKDCSDKAP